jgi:hypothetical protein
MLERELAELQVEWPDTPDIAAAVSVRLAAPPRPRRWILARPAWQVAIAVAALVIAVVMAVPPARSAVLDWLGLRSVRIEHREPRPSTFGRGLQLGTPVTLDQARRRAGFPVRVPGALGPPAAVYFSENPARIDLVYRDGKRVGVLVTELRATATPVIEKAIGAASRFERLEVAGDRAYFISGAQHGFAYIPAGTQEPAFEEQRLAGNTLLVERSDGLLLRIEGKLDRDAAVRIAESVR